MLATARNRGMALDKGRPTTGGGLTRWFNLVLGAVLAGCGLWSLVAIPTKDVLEWGLGVAVLVVGAEALLAALRGRASWISRVGPLP
jgi:hypothetical protein